MEKYLIALLLLLPLKAFAQIESFVTVCVGEKDFAKMLAEYEEWPIARGVSHRVLENSQEHMLVIFVNYTTRSWTIAEKIDGLYCVVGMGENFEPLHSNGNKVKY